MSRRMKLLGIILAVGVLLTPATQPARAASPLMPALGGAVFPMTFVLGGTYSAATVAGIISFRAAMELQVLYVTVVNQAKGGTQGVSTMGCLNAGTLFTNAVDLTGTAGTVLEATLVGAQIAIAKDATVTCDLTISGGSAPTISNITVTIWVQRRG